ncbi:hypothetical protein COV93_04055 [Candidatus Woesearchaeota archaeon CG11_big_fil_rev_8_21_14_0_20_43_8]|nr:MAG: hypothetical protein COV93_04055 [Candidatus Woesearchaeota archaeon CG11_big_fil_rev_8_21_14_0_20_43_8]PIO04753.1 MAG: hypothetical protein COT47_07655 [Candidatus Woesearchaeota archaeon CG08_land_8_20_14_0_20_43_7]
MNQRQIGILLIIIGFVVAGLVYNIKSKEDRIISQIIDEKGTCYLNDGTCLHDDRDMTTYIFGGAVALFLFVFGVYLAFIDKTHEKLAAYQITVSKALEHAKKQEKDKDEFKAFLSGFSGDEQKILSAIKEQDGIKQSTLRYRTGISKSSLSLMLKAMEDKDIISRKQSGKTNEIYLQKRF